MAATQGAVPAGSSRVAWAYVLLMSAPLFMSTNVVLGRALAGTVPPVGLTFWRWVVAAAILLPVAAPGLVRHRREILGRWPLFLLLGALGMGVCGAFVYIGLAETSATNAGLLYSTTPVFICLIAAVFLRQPITLPQAAGIVLASAGVVLVLTRGDPEVLLAFRFNTGDLWISAAVLAWAVYTLLIRQLAHLPTITVFAAVSIAGIVVLAPFYAWESLAVAPVVPTPEVIGGIVGVALFASVLAFSTYQQGVAVIGPGRAGAFMYLFPIHAAVMAILFLDEQPRLFHLAGLCLILPGVMLASLPRAMLNRLVRRGR